MQQNEQHISQGAGKIKRVVIAGGGTGGHIFPAIAIANALKRAVPGVDVLFVGAKGRMEMEKVPQAGYRIEGLDIAGFNRSSLIKNISLPVKLVKSFFQVKGIFKKFHPDAVIGVGGYSSFPVLRFAQAKGIPTFIHESNSFAGKSNILLGKKATRVFVASSGMQKFFPAEKIVVTGNPVRPVIAQVNSISKSEAVKSFGLDPSKRTVLAVGGSLGARSINEALANDLEKITGAGLQLIWQTGKNDAAKWQEAGKNKNNVRVSEFITNMEQAYAAADIVISRAGAMAIAELCLVRKPVIFVPYPFAAEDHQTMNAKNLVEKNAAIMVNDKEASERLVKELIMLTGDVNLQHELSDNIGRSGVPDADERIAQEIIRSV
jgi:UDP-N-acetylglucosamine--N-acetylmuramyl-(pentapeptide) pyrophosphoryl-undecaprenol N-acetylglucosamine transferase